MAEIGPKLAHFRPLGGVSPAPIWGKTPQMAPGSTPPSRDLGGPNRTSLNESYHLNGRNRPKWAKIGQKWPFSGFSTPRGVKNDPKIGPEVYYRSRTRHFKMFVTYTLLPPRGTPKTRISNRLKRHFWDTGVPDPDPQTPDPDFGIGPPNYFPVFAFSGTPGPQISVPEFLISLIFTFRVFGDKKSQKGSNNPTLGGGRGSMMRTGRAEPERPIGETHKWKMRSQIQRSRI